MIYNDRDIKVSHNRVYFGIDNKTYSRNDDNFELEIAKQGISDIINFLIRTNDDNYIDDSIVSKHIEQGFKTCLDKDSNEWYGKNMTDKPLTEASTGTIDTTTTVNNKGKEYYIMLPSQNDVIGDKKYPFNTYATLMANSNFNPVKKDGNYIYKKDIKDRLADFMEEAKKEFPNGKLPAPRQIEKHIKTMLECDIPLLKVENSPNGVVYKLTPKVDNKYYVRIPYQQVRELVISTNDNMLKLFVILSYKCDTKSYTTLDRKYFARKLGLSDNSDSTIKRIGTMLNSLRKLGFIDIRQEIRTDWDEEAGREVGKKINSYRLLTLDEYKEINKIARVKE